jgi:hypothetical protein
MVKPFQVDITARDRTQAGIRAAERRFEGMQKPLERLSKRTDRWAGGSGMARVARGLSGISGAGADAARGLGAAIEGASGLGLAASAAAWGLGSFVAVAGLAVAVGTKFGVEWVKSTSATTRLARGIGMASQELQQFQIAGKLAGVGAEAMTSALQGVGDVFNDAAWGRNVEAQGMLSQLGIRLKRTKDGAVDVKAAMIDIAKAMEGRSPQTQRKIASILGVEGALPFLNRGRAAVQRDLNDAMRSGAIVMDDQGKSAEELERSLARLEWRVAGLKRSMTENWVMPWLKPAIESAGRKGGWIETLTGAIDGDPKATAKIRKTFFNDHAKPRLVASGFGEFANRIEQQESRGRQFFKGTNRPLVSSAGAIGVMQLMPETAAATARKHGIAFSLERLRNDEAYNRRLGRLHLWDLQQKYGTEVLAAAAYNAGEGRLDGMWRGKGANRRWQPGWLKTIGDPRKGEISEEAFMQRIPIPETNGYVAATAGLSARPGQATVDINLRGAPRGTTAQVSGDRHTEARVKIAHAMVDHH